MPFHLKEIILDRKDEHEEELFFPFCMLLYWTFVRYIYISLSQYKYIYLHSTLLSYKFMSQFLLYSVYIHISVCFVAHIILYLKAC